MEWDTGAGHAIVNAAGGRVVLAEDESIALTYNKENLLNPWFIAERERDN
jgi:3'(2'), 5'-bisphosphate nucleotidase